MATTPPAIQIPQTSDFKTATSFSRLKKGRNTIGLVDLALDDYHDAIRSGDVRRKYRASIALVAACKKWLDAKAGSTKKNNQLRRVKVVELGQTAFEWLKFWQFESNKADRNRWGLGGYGGRVSPTQGLQPGYANERAQFGANKTQAPLSGTWIHQMHKSLVNQHLRRNELISQGQESLAGPDLPTNVKAILNKPFSNLTLADFTTIQQHNGAVGEFGRPQATVWYMDKTTRREFMMVVQDGILYKGFNTPLPLNDKYVYAMDKYGGLFGAIERNTFDPKGAAYLNHSTFNAGHDVICAGEIKKILGRPTITNESGHYTPDRDQLHEAVTILKDAGLKISSWQVGILEALPPNGNFSLRIYAATLFLANKYNPGPLITSI